MITRPWNTSRCKPQVCLWQVYPEKEQIHYVSHNHRVWCLHSQSCSLSAGAHPVHTKLCYMVNKTLNICARPCFTSKKCLLHNYISSGLLCLLMIKADKRVCFWNTGEYFHNIFIQKAPTLKTFDINCKLSWILVQKTPSRVSAVRSTVPPLHS